MSVVLLKLKGPQQSWGTTSRFRTRDTSSEPSKSGILGLVAAAQGRDRSADISDLHALQFGVRVDQPGRLMVDYQTALGGNPSKPNESALSWRHYRADASYVAAIAGPEKVIESIADALASPVFPLYLGRRSFPAPHDLLFPRLADGNDVETALRNLSDYPWTASNWYRKTMPSTVYLSLSRDAHPGETGELVNDIPVSFDPRKRMYSMRKVVRPLPIQIDNDLGQELRDPFFDLLRGN